MKAFLKLGLPLLLLAASAPVLWSLLGSHDDVFDQTNLFVASADSVKGTAVSAHLEAPIKEGANAIWCGTFQLVWNEICALVGEDLHFAGKEPPMVAVLNKKSFTRDDLDEASYVALAGYVRTGIYAQIELDLLRKFHGQASPTHLPSFRDAPRPQDIVGYAYLFKNLEFDPVFEKIEQPLAFGNRRVRCFGVGDEYKPGQVPMVARVLVIDYKNPDDFVIELLTKSNDDRVILGKLRPKHTLEETVAAVRDRMARGKPVPAPPGDVLKVPKFNFEITREYSELVGSRLAIANPTVAKDLQITSAVQGIRFQMDEKGVKLKSEAHVSIGCSEELVPHPTHLLIFDKPFLVMLQQSNAKAPYLAMWIGNAELLQRVDGE